MIDIPDYTPEENKEIFKRFSLPKTLKRLGMRNDELVVTEGALDEIIKYCEGRTGCRGLEQAAEHLAANALYRIETEGITSVSYSASDARALLNG